jgi:hypothetical protein
MVEKAERIKKIVSQKTLVRKEIKLAPKGEKTQCEFCKNRILDITRHLKKCHRNPDNSPKITINWEHIERYKTFANHLIKNPTTDKMKEYNKILVSHGNPFEPFLDNMIKYVKGLPKAHKDAMIIKKLDEIFSSVIEVRLLNKSEYIQKLKEKVLMGQRIFLFDPLKPTTVEEIEKNKDVLWDV